MTHKLRWENLKLHRLACGNIFKKLEFHTGILRGPVDINDDNFTKMGEFKEYAFHRIRKIMPIASERLLILN